MGKKIREQLPVGYLAVSRKFFEHSLWKERRPRTKAEAWLDLLQVAWFSDKPGEFFTTGGTVLYYRGEVVASLRHLMERWRWPMTSVHRFLDFLESENMISRRTSSRQTIISLTNYETYNGAAANPRGNSLRKNSPKSGKMNGTVAGKLSGTYKTGDTESIINDGGTSNGTPPGTHSGTNVENSRNNREEGYKKGKEGEIGEGASAPQIDPSEGRFKEFVAWIGKNALSVNQMKEPFTQQQYDRIREKYPKEIVQEVILSMHNKPDLCRNYRSANLTCQSWCNRRMNDSDRKPKSGNLSAGDLVREAQQRINSQKIAS